MTGVPPVVTTPGHASRTAHHRDNCKTSKNISRQVRKVREVLFQPKFLISIYQFMLYLTQRCGEAEFAEFIPSA